MKATGIVVIIVCCFWIGLGSILDGLNATVINGGYMKWNPERMTWQYLPLCLRYSVIFIQWR